MTAVEILVALAALAIVSALLVPRIVERLYEAQVQRAVSDLRVLSDEIATFRSELGVYPKSLGELPRSVPMDPWGNPYQYLSSADKSWRGKSRRDRFLVPLNSDFDLYSSGPDGRSVAPLTAKMSRDDVVRADDGGYYGVAGDF